MDNPLDLPIPGTLPEKRVVPGLIAPTEDDLQAETEIRLDREAQSGGFFDSVSRAFSSGDNYGYEIYKRINREMTAPPVDPNFKPMQFVELYKNQIPGQYIKNFLYSRSEAESQIILRDMQSELHDQDVLARRGGVGTFVAQGLAGIVDIDTPIALLTGGLGAGAKAAKWSSRLMRGAAFGGASQLAMATAATEASTTGDWVDIPLAGLAGAGFGMVGAMFSKGATAVPEGMANDAIQKAGKEFTETLDEGMPLAGRDIRSEGFGAEDPYGSVRAEQEAALAAEQAVTPQTYYHGTGETFTEFDNLYSGGVGFHFTTDGKAAAEYAGTGGRVISAELDIKHPAGPDEWKAALDKATGGNPRAMAVADLKAKGYDGVVTPHETIVFDAAQINPGTPSAKPQTFNLDEVEVIPDSIGENSVPGGSTVGAAQLNPQGSISTITDRRSLDMVQDATTWAQTSHVPDEYFSDNGRLGYKNGGTGAEAANAARRFHDLVVASPLVSDFDRLFRSGSVVAKKLAYDIFENAAGIVRNNRSAAMIRDLYEKQLLGSFMPAYQDGFKQWAQQTGVSKWDEIWSGKVRENFNREVMAELNGRAFDPPGTQRAVHPAVKEVADAHDRWSKLDIEIGQGRPGEHPIKGYEKLKAYSGYFSQKWSGSRINRLIHEGALTRDAITQAVAEGYVAKHGVPKADALIWAKAVMRRAMADDRGTDMNLIGVLQQDGRGFLEEMLRAQGIPQHEITSLIDRLTGAVEQRGQAGHTKGRVDIDLRFTASNGVKIMDLVDTDVARTVARRARGTSGSAALARKGIRSRADRQAIKDAILHEQQARGQSVRTGDKFTDVVDSDKHLTAEDIDNLFSYFDAGPIAGGVSPVYSRMKKLTNLALLNQLGLTQMAEVGVQIGSVGWTRWRKYAGEAFNAALGNPDSPLAKELQHLNVMVAEERLFRDDFAIEMDRLGTASTEFMQKFDHILNTGQRVQGYMSGFYHVRKFQQRVAVSSAADKIMTGMKFPNKAILPERAADIGLDPKTYARVKHYVDNGTVEFRHDGLHKLNLDKWAPEDAEDFALSLNRHVHQVVQKAMAGESSFLFHKDGVASLFFHLKSFPMLAMEKQALRSMRIADPEAMTGFLLGLVTAGAAYTVRQAINGRGDQLTAEKIARGAFGLSNMTGWLPMWTDPVATVFGMDNLKFNNYYQGIESNVFSTPAALPTINRMANIPGAIGSALTGNLSNDDVRALQATPIIGNAYGFSAIFNAMKD